MLGRDDTIVVDMAWTNLGIQHLQSTISLLIMTSEEKVRANFRKIFDKQHYSNCGHYYRIRDIWYTDLYHI